MLGLLPQLFHPVERQLVQGMPLGRSTLFHIIKPIHELFIASLKCRFGVDPVQAASIHQGEQQVAELLLHRRTVAGCHFGFDLGGFLLHLGPNILFFSQSNPVAAAFSPMR